MSRKFILLTYWPNRQDNRIKSGRGPESLSNSPIILLGLGTSDRISFLEGG